MAWKVISAIKTRVVEKIASTHVAGPHLADAIRVARVAASRGWGCTICPWENKNDSPGSMATRYRQTLKSMIQVNVNGTLSVKAPALQFDFELLKEILSVARGAGMRVQFDAQDPASAQPTFQLIEKAAALYRNVGCTLPARWDRSKRDADRAIELQIAVRVVKGMWLDPNMPRVDCRLSYLELVDKLAGRVPHVSVATHDGVVAAESLQRLIEAATVCELEILVGLPTAVAHVAEKRFVPVRVYIPYGTPHLPYNVSYVVNRPAIAGWVLRDLYLGRRKRLFEETKGVGYADA